jgi:acyl-CoA synthetase (AMP-forming)/AMP-acid ligase II
MFHRIISGEEWPGDRPAIVSDNKTVFWRDLAALSKSGPLSHLTLANRRVGIAFRATAACLSAVGQLDALKCDAFLMDANLSRDEVIRLGSELRLGFVLIEKDASWEEVPLDGELPGSGQSSVTILTSGTSGKPKAARHTWESLSRPTRRSEGAGEPRWLLTYRPHLYAGLQVLLQCLSNGGTLAVPKSGAAPAAVADLMRKARVEFVSATPSYWRRLLMFADPAILRGLPLKQITLGGEVVDQQILDALKSTFPQARITHIYATTELGRCFSVTDGRAGFPARYLSEPTPDGVEMRVEGGELMVRSGNSMVGYDSAGGSGFTGAKGYPTGDLVEVVGDRAFFVGRRTDMINVGGNKVHPIEVERVVRAVPGVFDARVYGTKSSIAGELVCCQVVPAAGAEPAALRQAVSTACLTHLTPLQRPRLIDVVPEIRLDNSGKTNRRTTG